MVKVFSTTIRVYYEDTDAGGIVYYANYLKFFERARSDWLRSLGIAHQELAQTYETLFVVHKANLICHRPALLDDLLSVDVNSVQQRKASMLVEQHAYRENNLGIELIAQGTVSFALLNQATMRPTPMPDVLQQRLHTSLTQMP